ncbi:hypothetical protein BOX15_Mlig001018g4, partial [Macrostomum lignano]
KMSKNQKATSVKAAQPPAVEQLQHSLPLTQDELTKRASNALRTVRLASVANGAICYRTPNSIKKSLQLFEPSELLLTITLSSEAKSIKSSDGNTIILTLPNLVHCPDTESGCLITKDLPRAPADYDATSAHYAELLKSCGVKASLTVLPLRELTVAYMPHEAKRRLCYAYDYFLADRTIVHRLGNKLGKQFGAKNRRKLPMPVDLEAKNLSAEIERALRCVRVCLNGSTLSCLVGQMTPLSRGGSSSDKDRLDEDQRLLANIVSACQQSAQRLASQYGLSIAGLYLRYPSCGNVPIFVADPAATKTASGADLAKTTKKKEARDLDKDLAELSASLWDQELLSKAGKKKKTTKAKTAQAEKKLKQSKNKRKEIGKISKSASTEQKQKTADKKKVGRPQKQKKKSNKRVPADA